MPKKPISIASRKAKSRIAQNWVAKKISELIHMNWGKDEVVAPREMGQSGVDIRLVGEAKEQFPWSVEVKNQETWKVVEAIQQAKDNQMVGTDWLVFMKKNHHEYIAILDAEVFFDILRLIHGKKGR